MKKIAKLKGAKTLSKTHQKSINGGAGGAKLCDTVCINASYGTRCDTHPLCPDANDGMCNGNGGWYYL